MIAIVWNTSIFLSCGIIISKQTHQQHDRTNNFNLMYDNGIKEKERNLIPQCFQRKSQCMIISPTMHRTEDI